MKGKRESWKSTVGFTFAALGSAVGLANICLFPYLVGKNGGAAFLFVYLIFLAIIGFPVFISEVLIGRYAQTSPFGAYVHIGMKRFWGWIGKLSILTGFIVTSFYSVLAGWVIGYFYEALTGGLSDLTTAEAAIGHYHHLIGTYSWCLFFHFSFIVICGLVLYAGVRHGIELCSKFMMPILIVLLLFLVLRGVTLPNASVGLKYLFSPDWSVLTPAAILIALGQAFFTLSLGQGTMITYGSYLSKEENIVKTCFPIAIGDTFISVCAAIAVFSIVFSVGMEPSQGLGLIFQTLPIVFTKLPAGYFMGVLFFLFVTLAAITSEISAMEPVIAYLVDEKKWKRHSAVIASVLGGFILGVPSALSFSLLKTWTIGGMTFIDILQVLAQSFLIPIGGFFAVFLVGWVWKYSGAMPHLKQGAYKFYSRHHWLEGYLWICIRYIAPILIIFVFLNQLRKVFGL